MNVVLAVEMFHPKELFLLAAGRSAYVVDVEEPEDKGFSCELPCGVG